MSLAESRLTNFMDLYGISESNQERIFAYLKALANKHPDTAEHSMRVAVLACEIARVEAIPGITPKLQLWAGALHDVGKAVVDLETLSKTEKFTKKDMKKMEPHVIAGWQMLDKLHDFTAAIIVRHHQFGPKPYPAKLPPLPEWLEPKKAFINGAARQLALADYYDALMTRKNAKFDKQVKGVPAMIARLGQALTGLEKRDKFYQDNADKARLIDTLEQVGLLKFPE